VDRKKPTLTSPGKVGLLVALLLVVTALGVSYFITGVFGITWHWIQVGGLSPKTWTFHLGAFLEELAPLLVITSLLAFGAYVLVAGAVRRYKAYVDSGVEYKQLLKSIKTIEDLDTADIADRLKAHPELREFLMGIKRRAAAMESPSSERIARHTQNMQAPQNTVSRDTVASECAKLMEAMDAGRDRFPSEIALTIPELKQIERGLRRVFSEMPQAQAPAPAPATDASAGALEELKDSVRSTINALRTDLAACAGGAREVEQAVTALSTPGAASKAPPAANAAALHKRIDSLAEAFMMLGEETRRIAIASALQASGGPEADTIKVADELKVLAQRFNTVARHWSETSPALKEIIAGSNSQPAPGDSPAAAQAANRARLWGERAVAMNEHVRSLERAVGVSPSARPVPAEFSSSAVDLDVAAPAPAPARAPAPAAAPASEDDFIARTTGEMFGNDHDISFADIPAFEKEHRLFADPPVDKAAESDDSFDKAQETRWDLADEKAEEPATASPQPAAKTSDHDGFLTGPRPTVKARVSAPPAAAPQPKAAPVIAPAPAPVTLEEESAAVATATLDPDADAMDLYALGAIDCVQTA
jgi:hypothetical protein